MGILDSSSRWSYSGITAAVGVHEAFHAVEEEVDLSDVVLSDVTNTTDVAVEEVDIEGTTSHREMSSRRRLMQE